MKLIYEPIGMNPEAKNLKNMFTEICDGDEDLALEITLAVSNLIHDAISSIKIVFEEEVINIDVEESG